MGPSTQRSDTHSNKSTSSLKILKTVAKKVVTTVKCKVTQLLSPKKHKKARDTLPDSSSDIADDSDGNPSPPLDAQSNKRRHKPEVIKINDKDEDSGDELNQMSLKWTSVVYAFYEPVPEIIYVDGKSAHQFSCDADTRLVIQWSNLSNRVALSQTREWIEKMLQEYEGKINFATDTWTSPNHQAYVGVTAHFEVQGSPISIVLDIVEVAESHTGKALAQAFTDILNNFGIDHKFDTKDNKKAKDGGLSDEEHELLKMEAEAAADEAKLEAKHDEDEDIPSPDNLEDEWVDKLLELMDEQRADLEEAAKPVQQVLMKRFVFKDLELTIQLMPHDVRTRWNSTYDMLSFALEYKDVILSLTAGWMNKLRQFELSVEEWAIAEQLAATLK
ncbi:hypothetical protein H0H81_004772, partial [Sphagnurus paluster]